MTSLQEVLVPLAAPWARLYGDAPALQTGVTFLHLAALVIGGGLALSLDRGTLRLGASGARADASGTLLAVDVRALQLARIGRSHRTVIATLLVMGTTGLAMLAADLDTYLSSRVFLLKMGLLALLLANGAFMGRTESMLARGAIDQDRGWRRLVTSAGTSVVLWLAITLAGVALRNA